MIGEEQDVVPALAKRRNGDGHGRNAEVQIFPKDFYFDGPAQIAIRGHNDAGVHFDQLGSADAVETFLLEHAQKLRLAGKREFGDFI